MVAVPDATSPPCRNSPLACGLLAHSLGHAEKGNMCRLYLGNCCDSAVLATAPTHDLSKVICSPHISHREKYVGVPLLRGLGTLFCSGQKMFQPLS